MSKIKDLIARVKQSTFFVSVFKVGSGQLIAQLMALASVPILSRIYTDFDYGDLAMITSTAEIILNIATMGLNSAIMKPEKDEESKTVFTVAFLTNFFISIAITVFCAVFSGWFKLMEIPGDYLCGLILMWIYIFVYSTSSLLTVYVNRKKEYNKLFFNPIIGAVANFVIAIPLGLLGLGYVGLMVTYIIQYLIIDVHMMWKDLPFASNFKMKDFKRVFVEYKEYVLFQYPSNFVGNFALEYPNQYLGRNFTNDALGDYSMCDRLLKYPIRLIAAPISTVYFKTATEYHQKGENLAAFTYKMISKVLLISVLPVAAFIMISEPLVAFVLGEEWRSAGTLSGFLIIQYVLLFCSQITSYCRVSIGQQKMNLVVTVVRLLVAMASLFIGYYFWGTVVATVFAYSVGEAVYNIFDLGVNFFCMDKKYMWKFLAISIAYTIIMFGFMGIRTLMFGFN